MFRSIKESIKEVVGQEKLKKGIEKGFIEKCWEESVGDSIKQNTTFKNYKQGVLTIKTKTPVWRNELLFQKEQIKKQLNKKIKNNKIKDIRFL